MSIRLNAESAPSVEDRALVFKAIGDPTRVRIIELLRAQSEEITGTEIAGSVGVSLALLCHHSSVLVEADGTQAPLMKSLSNVRIAATYCSVSSMSYGT